ncbi:MAG: methyltransferase domain-containing protein [Pirellulales bacterium]|nr:methyltransferase domain-containing protein [Pirellulales bacterium]
MTAAFDARAHSYAKHAFIQRDAAAWLAEWLEPQGSTASLAAIEFGPGDGVFTRRLAGRFASLRAVEIAPRMVARGAKALPEVVWSVGDAWRPERLGRQLVDRLYSSSMLQWCPDPTGVLRRWRRQLRPGGRTLNGFYVAPTLSEWRSLGAACSPFVWRSPHDWTRTFADAGWRVLRSESQTRKYLFPTALDLLRFFHRTGAVVPQKTPAGAVRRMLRELDRRYAASSTARGVPTEWTFFRIEAARE